MRIIQQSINLFADSRLQKSDVKIVEQTSLDLFYITNVIWSGFSYFSYFFWKPQMPQVTNLKMVSSYHSKLEYKKSMNKLK